jgi:pimeloyl-ACP methyl ester carboxylesterase
MGPANKLAIKYIKGKFRLLSALSKRKAAEKAFQLFCTPQFRNKKKIPAVFESGEKINLTINNDTVRGYRFNHPSDKKLIICHGYESSIINFDRYIKPLVKKGYEVLAFDAPAHGRSSGKRINALIYKNMLLAIDKQYGPIKNFIGHSLGGLALSLFLEETPHDEAYKLVLIAPATSTTTAVNHFFKFLELDEGVRTAFDNKIKEINNHPPSWYSVARAADYIRAEVLFLQDKNDEMTPLSDVKPIINKNYPNFRFIISEGLGHRRIYRDSGSFTSIIEFF